MFDNTDSFVALSRENTTIKENDLHPLDKAMRGGTMRSGDKVGERNPYGSRRSLSNSSLQ
jgi:hypothetical protein